MKYLFGDIIHAIRVFHGDVELVLGEYLEFALATTITRWKLFIGHALAV
jgi:hypothetical protein